MYNVYLLTKDIKYKLGAAKKLKEILRKQNKEGWFSEYGGADIGYLSLSIDYLAKYYQKTKDKNLLFALKKAVNFIKYFVLPNQSFGGEIGSRNTEYMVPHGFEILSKNIPDARIISNFIKRSINDKTTISPTTIDDRYLLFNGYTYLQAYKDGKDYKTENPFSKNFSKFFKESGLFIKNDKYFYIIINIHKGGVLKVIFKKNNNSLNDGGAIIKLKNNNLLSSGYLGRNNKVTIKNDWIEVFRNFIKVTKTSLTPFSYLVFRGFQITFGRNWYISNKMKNLLRNMLIKQKNRKTSISFSRRIALKDNKLVIIDEIKPLTNVDSIIISSKLSFIFAESSRFFQVSDLDSPHFIIGNRIISRLSNKRGLKLHREYNEKGILIKSEIL